MPIDMQKQFNTNKPIVFANINGLNNVLRNLGTVGVPIDDAVHIIIIIMMNQIINIQKKKMMMMKKKKIKYHSCNL